jgi:hypothetical protein
MMMTRIEAVERRNEWLRDLRIESIDIRNN